MQRLQVLIAEEKNLVALRLAAQFEALGHKVLGIVRDSPAAVASAWQARPDLILLGQQLPPHDGIEAARMILARQVVPLILVIGYPAAGLVQRAQETGILAYLVWPAEARALESAIQVAQTRFRELRILNEQVGDLHQALRTRMVVGRAKVLLMRWLGLAEADAFGYVHRQSRRTGKPLGEVAEDLVTAGQFWFEKSGLAGCIDVTLQVLTRAAVLERSRLT